MTSEHGLTKDDYEKIDNMREEVDDDKVTAESLAESKVAVKAEPGLVMVKQSRSILEDNIGTGTVLERFLGTAPPNGDGYAKGKSVSGSKSPAISQDEHSVGMVAHPDGKLHAYEALKVSHSSLESGRLEGQIAKKSSESAEQSNFDQQSDHDEQSDLDKAQRPSPILSIRLRDVVKDMELGMESACRFRCDVEGSLFGGWTALVSHVKRKHGGRVVGEAGAEKFAVDAKYHKCLVCGVRLLQG